MTNDASTTGYTKQANWIADGASERPAAVTVLLVVLARYTAGWQRDTVTLGVNQLAVLCGLSPQGTRNAIGYALGARLIAREAAGNQGHTYRLRGINSVEGDQLSVAPYAQRGSTECSPLSQGDQLSVAQGINSVEGGGSTECSPAYKDERKSLKKGKERERESNAPAERAPTAVTTQATEQHSNEPVYHEAPARPARTPSPVSAPPPPAPVAAELVQPRLVETADADPVAIYREVAKVAKPNQAQRVAIRDRVLGDVDIWREVCDRWQRNGWNARAVDNLIDAYDKAVAERRRKERLAADAERERREREAVPQLTPEQRAENLRRFAEGGKRALAAADAAGLTYVPRPLWRARSGR